MRTEKILALGLFDRGSRLGERIEMLLARGREFSGRTSRARVAVGIAAMIGLIAAGSMAPRWIAFAQEAKFDAASVRPNPTYVGSRGRVSKTPGRFVGQSATARLLIREAYGVKDYQLTGGPAWLDSDRFDVEGKSASVAGDVELRAMLRTLLAERFKLVVHQETKEMAVYDMVVGKNGVKFSEVKPGEPRTGLAPKKPGMQGRMFAANVSALADMLSSEGLLGKPVLDKTGLTGNYLIDIQTGPDEDLITVVQDQGLRLEPAKGSIETVVIDHVEKPGAN
ncbi:MAG TPA: TIGR03435 family protein [Bryobacteraceae bacterium]|jgi:uncharacterized protein (TIGR03435 family)